MKYMTTDIVGNWQVLSSYLLINVSVEAILSGGCVSGIFELFHSLIARYSILASSTCSHQQSEQSEIWEIDSCEVRLRQSHLDNCTNKDRLMYCVLNCCKFWPQQCLIINNQLRNPCFLQLTDLFIWGERVSSLNAPIRIVGCIVLRFWLL